MNCLSESPNEGSEPRRVELQGGAACVLLPKD